MSLRFKRRGAQEPREYEVYDGEALIGTVKRYEQRYNLRRVYVTQGWRATAPDGQRLHGERGATAERRGDAARALLAYATLDSRADLLADLQRGYRWIAVTDRYPLAV